MKELSKKYSPKEVEEGKYNQWKENGLFDVQLDKRKPNFSIILPPPNVTGKLHLGHSWDGTLQDILIRYKRLKGFNSVWIPGMDHAGIATQAKVEARLRETEGKLRHDFTREEFLDKAWEWKEEYAQTIRSQWATMGFALDYSREKFTLDKDINKAVNKVFVSMFKKGLIYRGERLINWDPVQKTALSNIEVIHEDRKGKMYNFKYRLESDSEQFLVVATTRPETLFGDSAIIVHPKDERYSSWVGKKVVSPADGRLLEVITDSYIDIEFGTGVMKCSPAHDFNDFELGKKHNLDLINCMNEDASMNAVCGVLEGMDRYECRKQIVERTKREGNLHSVQDHDMSVGLSERSNAIVEPLLSKQWFVDMDTLAKNSLDNQEKQNKVNFHPERFEKTFTRWMGNIQDWCISRQLWWGHRIPAWYHIETGEVHVGDEPRDIENWKQDEDVLDTWFSSALWPFTSVGWPEKTMDFDNLFPTSVLVTGYDIIFFWVSRMIFQSLEFTDQRPFKDVLIHGLIRDEKGRKMSKSLGNGIDPLDVIEEYGADALRHFLVTNSTPGQDIRYSVEKLRSSWNFINKLWNSMRFIMMNYEKPKTKINLEFHHKWIMNKFNDMIKVVDENMDKYDFVLVGQEIYKFVWNDFCNTFLELTKKDLMVEDKKDASIYTLVTILEKIIVLLHPFIPFVTEEMYTALPRTTGSVMNAEWPKTFTGDLSEGVIDTHNEIISVIRNYRKEKNLAKKLEIRVYLRTNRNTLIEEQAYLRRILQNENIVFIEAKNNISDDGRLVYSISSGILLLETENLFNKEEEVEKLSAELKKLASELERSNKMLSNPRFVEKAPESKIIEERAKLSKYEQRHQEILIILKKMV